MTHPPRRTSQPPAASGPVADDPFGPGTHLAPTDDERRLRALARLLDAAVRIPGTNVRVGLDPILGLVPGVGDLAAGALSAYVIVLGWRSGAPTSVLLRMLGNVGVDALVGAVPLLGDLFDVGFKANVRNVALLDRWKARPTEARRASRLVVAAIVGGVLLAVAGAVTVSVLVVRAIAGAM